MSTDAASEFGWRRQLSSRIPKVENSHFQPTFMTCFSLEHQIFYLLLFCRMQNKDGFVSSVVAERHGQVGGATHHGRLGRGRHGLAAQTCGQGSNGQDRPLLHRGFTLRSR